MSVCSMRSMQLWQAAIRLRGWPGRGRCRAPAAGEDGGLVVGAGGGHDFAVAAGAGGDLVRRWPVVVRREQFSHTDAPARAGVCTAVWRVRDRLARSGVRVRRGRVWQK